MDHIPPPTPFTDDPTYLARFTLHRHFLSTYVGFRRLHTQCITRCDCKGCLGGDACVGSLGKLREERYRARVGWLEEWGVNKGMVLSFAKTRDRSADADEGDVGSIYEDRSERGGRVVKRRKLECSSVGAGRGVQGEEVQSEEGEEETELEREAGNLPNVESEEVGMTTATRIVLPKVKCNIPALNSNLTTNTVPISKSHSHSSSGPKQESRPLPPPPPPPPRSLRQRTRTTTPTTKLLKHITTSTNATNITKPSTVVTTIPASSTPKPPLERRGRTRARPKLTDQQPKRTTSTPPKKQSYSPPDDWVYFRHPPQSSRLKTKAKSAPTAKRRPSHSPAPQPRPPHRNHKPLLTVSGDFDLDGLIRLCNRAAILANLEAPAVALGEDKRWLSRNLKICARDQ